MAAFLGFLCFLLTFQHVIAQCTVPSSEFYLDGDYLLGGLFNIHQENGLDNHDRPEFTNCSSKPFILSSYRRFQLMRFSVEEINNSTSILPNISLGYEVFDHCSDGQSFPGVFKLISSNGWIQPWGDEQNNPSKTIAVLGTYSSYHARPVAPLFMMNLIPMVSYGATSSVFSNKQNFPSFLRTVHTNKDTTQVIVNILRHFNWTWVAFLYNDDDYGIDGLNLFIAKIKDTKICLAYNKALNNYTDYSLILKQINRMKIGVIIVYTLDWTAETLVKSAIEMNTKNKVWIAGDGWSLNKNLPKKKGIENIGTILGVAGKEVKIPGFNDFISATKSKIHCEQQKQNQFCNQACHCSHLTAEDVIGADPSFSFTVYSAVYAVAHALHRVLQCGAGNCTRNITVYPHMVLAELKKSYFTLLNRTIGFDENGDPKYGNYSIIFWNHSGETQEIGFSHHYHPSYDFFINTSKIQWFTKGEVPTSLCSPECPAGSKKKYDGIHKCCFTCEICPNGTYVNSTEDPYKCIDCKETEWSEEGSTSCKLRAVEYVPFTDGLAILIMVAAWVLVGLTLAMSVLFVINYNTPVVRSAGGPMCFLILGCLSLCSISVFFNFGKPTRLFCILRFLPFLLFYTVCLACFVVRSFQIFYIFKLSAKISMLHSWWSKYHGQWVVIAVVFVIQTLLVLIGICYDAPKPSMKTDQYPDIIILSCDIHLKASSGSVIFLLSLCFLCFIFSYMGKDLPKNYNEAKAITFCLLLLILTWIMFAVYVLNRGKYIQTLNALAILFSLYSFLLFYFLPKCCIIIFQSYKNTQEYFQGLIKNYASNN